MAVAKVFWSGNSQAVRLPREFRLPTGVNELQLHREGERIVLEPQKRRQFSRRFWNVLGSLPAFKRPRQIRQNRGILFP